MITVVSAFRDGGPVMYLLLTTSLLGAMALLAGGVLQAAKVKLPASAWLLVPLLFLALGALGTGMGLHEVDAWIRRSHPSDRASLLAAGYAVAPYPGLYGLLLAALGSSFGGFAVGLGTLVGGRDQPLQLRPALGIPAVGVVVATVAAGAGVGAMGMMLFVMPLALVGPAVGVAAAAARGPEAADQQVRAGTGQLVAPILGLLAVLAAGEFCVVLDQVNAAKAVAMAPDVEAAAMIAAGQTAASWQAGLTLGAALFGAPWLLAPGLRSGALRGMRSWDGVVTALLLALTLAALFSPHFQMAGGLRRLLAATGG